MSIIADDNDFENDNELRTVKKNHVLKPKAIDLDKNFKNCILPKYF